ncbi:MAG TPA: glycoside hydrolase family 130 protein [Chthoniobacteraceae bacterium]|jgi:predicted GH43/DUF377 family glycosyl hydrolase
MSTPVVCIRRREIKIEPDSSRVLIRPFIPSPPQRIVNVLGRGMSLSEEETERELARIMEEFGNRHARIEQMLLRHFERVRGHLPTSHELSRARQLFLGALFTGEYALESAALFNPSIVPHPDQSGLPDGALRFVMSLRATGEGHISSIEFRSGVIKSGSDIHLDPASRFVTTPELVPNPTYNKASFAFKLAEMDLDNVCMEMLMETLDETFTLADLDRGVGTMRRRAQVETRDENRTVECVRWLAESNYEIAFDERIPLSERIIFPVSSNESNGIEDARFVRFTEDDGSVCYYATYTAYNGRVILPQLIHTTDFLNFRVITLNGRAVQNKGMALFPRRIDGRYVMLSRQDDENLFIMFSDNAHYWHEHQPLLQPDEPWEFAKIGNCGSPIETEAGWLVITHGVGPMRKYCIGAILLDLEQPDKVIGRLRSPLLEPEGNEREGYVPNVVYTCGALIHGSELILPYAMSDKASSIATVDVEALLSALLSS